MNEQEYLKSIYSRDCMSEVDLIRKQIHLVGGFGYLEDWSNEKIDDFIPSFAFIAKERAVCVNLEKFKLMAEKVTNHLYNEQTKIGYIKEDDIIPSTTDYLAYYACPYELIVISLMTLDTDISI